MGTMYVSTEKLLKVLELAQLTQGYTNITLTNKLNITSYNHDDGRYGDIRSIEIEFNDNYDNRYYARVSVCLSTTELEKLISILKTMLSNKIDLVYVYYDPQVDDMLLGNDFGNNYTFTEILKIPQPTTKPISQLIH